MIRNIVFSLVGICCFYSCTSDEQSANPYINNMNLKPSYMAMLDSVNYSTIEFREPIKDLGNIRKGEIKKVQFTFRNNGDKPILVDGVSVTCGCTIAGYEQAPVWPGKEGTINVEFNSSSQSGTISKKIVVTTNTKPATRHTLTITGTVLN